MTALGVLSLTGMKSWLCTEVCLLHCWIVTELSGRATERNRSGFKYVRALSNAQCEVGVLLNDEHRGAFVLVDLLEGAKQIFDDDGSQTE